MDQQGRRIEKKFPHLSVQPDAGLFLIDQQGRISDINRAFTGLLGYRCSEIRGRHFAELRYNISQKGERQDEFIGSFGLFLFYQAVDKPMPLILRHKNGERS